MRQASARNLVNPGSELRARFRRPDHPLAYGYPESTSVFRDGGPVYAVRRVDEGRIVLQWGTKIPRDDEEEKTRGRGQGREEGARPGGERRDQGRGRPRGQARAPRHPRRTGAASIAFAFDPIHRYQTESDFRLVWNAILNWNDLPPTPAP